MNQKGEVTLLGILIMVGLSGLMLLSSLELKLAFQQLQKRTHLFLCAKETKGELAIYLKRMGRSNWALKNIEKAKLVMMFIPGLQGVAANSEKAKELLKVYQDLQLILYWKKLQEIQSKKCALDPGLFKTPYRLGGLGYERRTNGAAIQRENEWTYYFVKLPYSIGLRVKAQGLERIQPKLKFFTKESGGRSLFL